MTGAACCAAGLATVGASAASGADGIPRPPGAIDNRGYELINPVDKNANLTGVGIVSDDGERILYVIGGGSDLSTTGVAAQLVATRSSAGWSTRPVTPPAGQYVGDSYVINAVTGDLSGFVATANTGGASAIGAPTVVRIGANRDQTILQPFALSSAFGSGPDIVTSDDLTHVFGAVDEALIGEHPAGTFQVYDFGSGTPQIVSRMPGTDTPPLCGTPLGSSDGFAHTQVAPTVSQHRVSADGRRVFFETRGDVCTNARNLYMRDLLTGETTLITGPVDSGTDSGVERFMQAAEDGSWVVYRTRTRYSSADTNTGTDVYRYTVGAGNECVTCIVANASVQNLSGTSFNAVMSEDGSTLYFLSTQSLNGLGTAGQRNLYVIRNGVLGYVSSADTITHSPDFAGQVTADGDVLLYRSRQAMLNALTGTDNGGTFQYYRYDHAAQSVTCLSCPPTGAATASVSTGFLDVNLLPSRGSAMSADGDIVVFRTDDKLVDEDINGTTDIYEWHNGEVGLITDGVVPTTSSGFPQLMTVSADGQDILFHSIPPLVPGVYDGALNLYTARIGGGFLPSAEPPASCAGDSCQGLIPPAPDLQDPASTLLRGVDELVESGEAQTASFRIGKVSRAQRRAFARRGHLILRVRASDAGRVRAVGRAKIGKRVRRVARGASSTRAGRTVRLRLTLSRAARRQLASGHRLRVAVTVRYSQSDSAKRVRLTLPAVGNGR